jgi:4-amino-4-deoxychorismate lyase
MNNLALLNGEPASTIPMTDRGLQYGDGLFETIAIRAGQAEFLKLHLSRLELGCARLGIDYPGHQLLTQEINQLAQQQSMAVVKVQLSVNTETSGYLRSNVRVNRILRCTAVPQRSGSLKIKGIRLRLARHRLAINPVLAGLKHLNRLDNVIARNECGDALIQESVMLDTDGYVVEGTMSNIFLLSNACLMTPCLNNAGVDGIIRGVILKYARLAGMAVEIRKLTVSDLISADALFVTNSLIHIWPVQRFETHHYADFNIAAKAQQWVMEALERCAE